MLKWKYLIGALVVGAALAGCGGGDGQAPVQTETPAAPAEPPPPLPIKYSGTLSFGDTIALTVDAPSRGRVTLSFVDSAFGLRGTVIGNYTSTDGNYTVSGLEADSADPPPATLTARLAGIGLTFRQGVDGLFGEISGVPNLLGTSTGLLAGDIAANVAPLTAPALSSLAGGYNVLMNFGIYDQATGKPLVGPVSTAAGMRFDTEGNVELCTDADLVTCVTPQLGKLTLADQTRFPGAYDLVMNGGGYFRGRLFVNPTGGLRFDMNYAEAGSVATGTWTIQPATALVAGELDGTWACSRANRVMDGAAAVMDGTLVRDTLTIADGKLTTASKALTLPLMLNAFQGGMTLNGVALAINGDPDADPDDPAAAPPTFGQILLKTGADSLAWLNLTDSSVFQGTCRRAS
ncbi:hypothetical protein D3C81_652310 [compost metagenome]